MTNFDLQDKIALVTGAGTGLGRQFALTLTRAGATVVLAARRESKLEETASLIAEEGGRAHCLALDVTDSTSVRQCFDAVDSRVGTADILVNNAGVSGAGFLGDLSESDWDTVLDTNLKGVFLVAQAAMRAMVKAEKGGSIVNIASILGLRAAKRLGGYMAAKSAVIHLTRSMALEWARYGIRVNAIAPGYFRTEINDDFLDTEEFKQAIKQVPMRRIGKQGELDGPLLLLASDAGSYMTGSTLTVDGGHVCSSL